MLVACEIAVAALGWWQHRSIDALSRNEIQVLKWAMRERAAAFVDSFDSQIQTLISALAPGAMGNLETSAAELAFSLQKWRSTSVDAALVRGVWRSGSAAGGAAAQERPGQWLKLEGPRWIQSEAREDVAALCRTMGVDPEQPLRVVASAIVLPVISLPPRTEKAHPGCLVALLDASRLREQLVQSLLKKHVNGSNEASYFYAIRDLSEGRIVSGEVRGQPEVRLPFLFAKRDQIGAAVLPPALPTSNHPVIIPLATAATNRANWELLVGPVGGSIEDQVRSTRKLNLAATWMLAVALGLALIAIQKALDRSEHLQAQQNQFVAAVSHELRSPLAAIRTLAQNQADGVVTNPEQTAEYGRLLVGEADRLHATFEHCLAFAGIRSLAVVVPDAPLDIARTAQAACARFRADHPDARITYLGEESALVSCNRILFEQTLHNLLDNSRKFARTEGMLAEVSVVRQADDWVITVRDQGIGVSLDEVSELGKPFFRGRYARDRQIAGLGVGLSLARSFAERSGGRLRIERRKEGFAVSLILPAGQRDERRR